MRGVNWTLRLSVALVAFSMSAMAQSHGKASIPQCIAQLAPRGITFTFRTEEKIFMHKFYAFMQKDNDTVDVFRCRRKNHEADIDCTANGRPIPFDVHDNSSLKVNLSETADDTTGAVYKMRVGVNDSDWTPIVTCEFKRDEDVQDDDKTPLIVGCTVATVILLILAVVGIWCYSKRRKNEDGDKTVQMEEQEPARDPLMQPDTTENGNPEHDGSAALNERDTSTGPQVEQCNRNNTIDRKADGKHDEQDSAKDSPVELRVDRSSPRKGMKPAPSTKPEWFSTKMSEQKAHKLLKTQGNMDGCFLIRTSEKKKKTFYLSVLSGGVPSSFVIYVEHDKYYMESDHKFDHLRDLVNHYTEEKGCLPTTLQFPCTSKKKKGQRSQSTAY